MAYAPCVASMGFVRVCSRSFPFRGVGLCLEKKTQPKEEVTPAFPDGKLILWHI